MAITHAGAWGTPEFGITEKISDWLGKGRTSQGGSNLLGGQSAGSVLGTQTGGLSSNVSSGANQSFYTPTVQNVNNKSSGGFSSLINQNPQSSGGQGPVDTGVQINSPSTPFAGGSSVESAIQDQFNAFNANLDSQEGRAKQNYQDVLSLYGGQKETAEKKAASDRDTQTTDIKKNESLNLARVRQLLGDLQQRNAARTAITGGGSTSDVLAERFGRTAQEQLGNVQDQTASALQRVNDFYNNSIQQLNDSYQSQLLSAKQTLDDNLAQIQSARTQSAAAKQANTIQAWQDYYNNINQAKIQAAQFKQQYDLWKSQQDNAYAAQLNQFQPENANMLNQGVAPSFDQGNYGGYGIQPQPQQTINPLFRTGQNQNEDEELNYTPIDWTKYQTPNYTAAR